MGRLFQFVFAVIFGINAGIVADTLHCLAHRYHNGGVVLDSDSLPWAVASIIALICMAGLSLWFHDKLINFKQQKITYIATFIVAAIISGYYFYLPCV